MEGIWKLQKLKHNLLTPFSKKLCWIYIIRQYSAVSYGVKGNILLFLMDNIKQGFLSDEIFNCLFYLIYLTPKFVDLWIYLLWCNWMLSLYSVKLNCGFLIFWMVYDKSLHLSDIMLVSAASFFSMCFCFPVYLYLSVWLWNALPWQDIDCMPSSLFENMPTLLGRQTIAVDKFFEDLNELKINGRMQEFIKVCPGDNVDTSNGISQLSSLTTDAARPLKQAKAWILSLFLILNVLHHLCLSTWVLLPWIASSKHYFSEISFYYL